MLVIKWMFYLEIKTTSYPINIQYLQKIQTFEAINGPLLVAVGVNGKQGSTQVTLPPRQSIDVNVFCFPLYSARSS